ncbi:MAG: DUF4185 domain-containing protein [Calditrichaeota bacterium]|nr:DUF4185 domain-containing protein [Calditrichota bacterium]
MKIKQNKLIFALSLVIVSFFVRCKFDRIEQPAHAAPGEVIEIKVTISDNIDETTNPHKGVLCVLVPDDWQFLSGEYAGRVGSGEMFYSPEWSDSAEACYPAAEFGDGMNWIALISDTGYTYTNNPSVEIDTHWQVGEREGCFSLAYLATKATRDLICTGWSPFSYPHPIGIPDICDTTEALRAEPAPEWSELFHRKNGWTGSDAVYSIPISGYDYPSPDKNEKTIFVFGDTFIGEVGENDQRVNAKMIRNTVALLRGKEAIPESLSFYWKTTSQTIPAAMFEADTPNSKPGDWIWPMDGISLNDKIYVFGLRLDYENNYFRIVGTTLISFELDSADQIINYRHVDAPLFYQNQAAGMQFVLGQAVMPMTDFSGNPNPDGYIYVYGPRNSFGNKGLVASRVLPENFADFSQWEFWNGTGWSNNIADCAVITNGISQEFSVSPLKDGRFLLVFEAGGKVKVKFGESPVGPFQAALSVYDCPEPGTDPDIFVYNAKAHPHLSSENVMLISYNVNTFSLYDLMHRADIYRPRFIWLKLFDEGTPVDVQKGVSIPEEFDMLHNFPNPFNGGTTIFFSLRDGGVVSVEIFNLLGEKVNSLMYDSFKAPGKYFLRWNGKDFQGKNMSSGIYLCQLKIHRKIYSQKMLLLR